MKLTKNDAFILNNCNIVKTEGDFVAKPLIVVVDEMSEVMEGSDYKAVSKISESISSIARLGRAAACHLVLATQRPSGNVINSDLKNNIQLSTILGDFGSSESGLVLDDDYSAMAKPEIKGRGFIKTGQTIQEYQSFYIDQATTLYEYKKYNQNKPVINLEQYENETSQKYQESNETNNSETIHDTSSTLNKDDFEELNTEDSDNDDVKEFSEQELNELEEFDFDNVEFNEPKRDRKIQVTIVEENNNIQLDPPKENRKIRINFDE